MPASASTRLASVEGWHPCPACGAVLADATATACANCERPIGCPSSRTWPARLLWLLAALSIHRQRHAWVGEDDLWRRLLEDGVAPQRMHSGTHRRMRADDAYPIALAWLADWERVGCPIDREALGALWDQWCPTSGAPNPYPCYPRPTRSGPETAR